jgi:hypothetical protein
MRDEIRQVVLTGGQLDELDHWNTFYDPDGDADGTPDAGCPKQFNALEEAGDGWLYGANTGDNPGIWRIWHDDAGPREVSAPGSPLQLTVGKVGSNVELTWENLGPLDASYPNHPGNQSPAVYQIWEGTLPILPDGSGDPIYTHGVYFGTNGQSAGVARLKQAFPPLADDRYYLVSAQGENLRGTTGAASDGTPRGGEVDYCLDLPLGRSVGQCAREWFNPANPSEELRLKDYNPNSHTYLQDLNLSDFRGKVLRLDISANNCTFCNLQAPFAAAVEEKYGSRDFVGATVLTKFYQTREPIPEEQCQAFMTNWVNQHGSVGPLLCDIDLDGNGRGDVSDQYWTVAGCGGTPQNYYIDQEGVVYSFVCGGQLSEAQIINSIIGEVNPETCE